MNTKGQGALEYLLLIGGAVVVASIVVIILLGLGSTNQDVVNKKERETEVALLAINANSPPNCDDLVPETTIKSSYVWDNSEGTCWRVLPGSVYPKCTLERVTTAQSASYCCANPGTGGSCTTTGGSDTTRYTVIQ